MTTLRMRIACVLNSMREHNSGQITRHLNRRQPATDPERMHILNSIDDLPEWFQPNRYRKQLSAREWYFEVRKRQYLSDLLAMIPPHLLTGDPPLIASHPVFMRMLQDEHLPPGLYLMPPIARPLQDLTIFEAMYFRPTVQDQEIRRFVVAYDSLLTEWMEHVHHEPSQSRAFGEYESQLEVFVDGLSDDLYEKLDVSIWDLVNAAGNPWLSYGQPIAGLPITVDLRYDAP